MKWPNRAAGRRDLPPGTLRSSPPRSSVARRRRIVSDDVVFRWGTANSIPAATSESTRVLGRHRRIEARASVHVQIASEDCRAWERRAAAQAPAPGEERPGAMSILSRRCSTPAIPLVAATRYRPEGNGVVSWLAERVDDGAGAGRAVIRTEARIEVPVDSVDEQTRGERRLAAVIGVRDQETWRSPPGDMSSKRSRAVPGTKETRLLARPGSTAAYHSTTDVGTERTKAPPGPARAAPCLGIALGVATEDERGLDVPVTCPRTRWPSVRRRFRPESSRGSRSNRKRRQRRRSAGVVSPPRNHGELVADRRIGWMGMSASSRSASTVRGPSRREEGHRMRGPALDDERRAP